MRQMELEQAMEVIRAAVKTAGSQTLFAQQHGMSAGYVNDVLRRRKDPGQVMLDAVGLQRVVVYRRKSKQDAGGGDAT